MLQLMTVKLLFNYEVPELRPERPCKENICWTKGKTNAGKADEGMDRQTERLDEK